MERKYDIFVSYAHVDNASLFEKQEGWVSQFIEGLRFYLNKIMGRAENYTLWMDYELRGNTPLTVDILESLENSKILLLMLSPGYIQSEWCMKELNSFIAKYGENTSRIFVIEQTFMTEKPSSLNDLLGYKFWTKDSSQKIRTLALPTPRKDEIEYYQKLNDVATQLSEQLLLLQDLIPTEGLTDPISTESTICVFIARCDDRNKTIA